jgi:CMP-N-acetylneuraminic acid synthetase
LEKSKALFDMECLAIIPARGGSKGILRKNIFPLAGKPLIAYNIEQALRARLVSRVVGIPTAERGLST